MLLKSILKIMKTTNLFIFLLIAINISSNAQNNILITNELRVNTHVFNTEMLKSNLGFSLFFEMKNIRQDSINTFVMNQLLADKVNMYFADNNNLYKLDKNKMTVADLTEKMGGGNDTVIVDEPGNFTQQIIPKRINIEEVKSFVFLDSWAFDVENFTFKKNVISYYPIRWYYKPDDISYENVLLKKLCRLDFETMTKKEIQKSDKRLIHYATVKYEQLTDNQEEYFNDELKYVRNEFAIENNDAPFFTSYSKQMLSESIINKVITGKTQAYDFNTQKPITAGDVKMRMGMNSKTMLILDSNSNLKEVTIEGSVDFNEIRSYIFTEDWYLDPITLRIVKKVRAIAPVRYYYKEEDVEQKNVLRIIIFDVKLN